MDMVIVRPKTSCTHAVPTLYPRCTHAVPSTTLLVFYEEAKYFTHLKCVK